MSGGSTRPARRRALLLALGALPVAAFAEDLRSVADTPTSARTPDGRFIHWVEHRIDDEGLGGEAIRGGDGLLMADVDGDGRIDVVSVHEDSHHLRIAFGSEDPDRWTNVTIAHGHVVGAIEDVAAGDLDGDGDLDLVAACEEAHLSVFANPGGAKARRTPWPALVPSITTGRGSWLQVAVSDLDGDGRPEVIAANKGHADVVRLTANERPDLSTSRFRIDGDPLDDASWHEQSLLRDGIPNQVVIVDVDDDGDPDVLAAERLSNRMTLLVNEGVDAKGMLRVTPRPIAIAAGFPVPEGWRGFSNAFNAVFADLDGDGRKDLVVSVLEAEPGETTSWTRAGLGWLSQPDDLAAPWTYHRIGDVLPDWVIGIGVADIDGDGSLDAVVGGYSGLNVVRGGYSGASRDVDDPSVTASSSVARIAWFRSPGNPSGSWTRHDVSRRVRGMYDDFVARDLDGDGDVDFVATRGNSGEYDGVFWLEQRRSTAPQPAFVADRLEDSRALPLPPADWRIRYGEAVEYVAPNKAAQDAALRAAERREGRAPGTTDPDGG